MTITSDTAMYLYFLAAIFFIVGLLNFMEKGPLLNNVYTRASKKQREKMDKKLYYRQSGIVLMMCSGLYLLIALAIVLKAGWLYIPAVALGVGVAVYAVRSTARINKK